MSQLNQISPQTRKDIEGKDGFKPDEVTKLYEFMLEKSVSQAGKQYKKTWIMEDSYSRIDLKIRHPWKKNSYMDIVA